jgi:hypothetical protein
MSPSYDADTIAGCFVGFYKKDVGPAKLTAPRDLFRGVRARIPDVRNQLSGWPVFNSKFHGIRIPIEQAAGSFRE